jgi:4-amino-4-deoxy-L-arabinose transferase-like glycosyltransferase
MLAALAVALGILPAFWGGIDNGDSVRYLNMASALASGDRGGVINGLWSPLYPILHALALRLFHPSWKQELRVVSLVDFIIYFSSIACFQFFWAQVSVLYRKLRDESASVATSIMLPERSFWILGYSIFLYSHLPLISAGTPDLLLAAIVNLAAGILLEIRFNTGSSLLWPAFGAILGVGYLTKAVLFPLSFVFLACAILAGRLDRRKLANGFVACGMLLAISAPFVWAITNKEGHLTIGDSGRLNYAWHVNRTPGLNWQGLPPGFGVPLHPTTRILEVPEAYKFPGNPNEIFPPFDNPSYWNEGLRPRFVLFAQLRSWKTNSLD